MSSIAKNTLVRLLAFVAFCSVVGGCVHFKADPEYGGPKALPQKERENFTYTPYEGRFEEKILENGSTYILRQIRFPSTHNILPVERDILIDYYQLKGPGKKPVILILPVLGGSNSVEESFAKYFAHHGFSAALVHRQDNYKADNLEFLDPNLRQMVFDHKQALDWIETREELDASRIGVFGISMGGIKAALLTALDDRIGASVLAMAGGDIPYILANSNERGIAKIRERYMRERRLTRKELQKKLSRRITTDPMRYAENIDADKVLMILAMFDGTVPIEKGKELQEKIGNPETVYLLSGHYTAALFKNLIKYKARKFFERTLPKR